MHQVEIIKQINNYRIIIHLKRRNYNDNIYEYSRHLKVIKDDRVRNLLGKLFQYFEAATVKAASAYIDETSGTESFISSHMRPQIIIIILCKIKIYISLINTYIMNIYVRIISNYLHDIYVLYASYINKIYIYIYIILVYIYTTCVTQLANTSDTQAVGCGFEPRPDH